MSTMIENYELSLKMMENNIKELEKNNHKLIMENRKLKGNIKDQIQEINNYRKALQDIISLKYGSRQIDISKRALFGDKEFKHE